MSFGHCWRRQWVRLSARSFVRTSVCPFVRSYVRTFLRSSICSLVRFSDRVGKQEARCHSLVIAAVACCAPRFIHRWMQASVNRSIDRWIDPSLYGLIRPIAQRGCDDTGTTTTRKNSERQKQSKSSTFIFQLLRVCAKYQCGPNVSPLSSYISVRGAEEFGRFGVRQSRGHCRHHRHRRRANDARLDALVVYNEVRLCNGFSRLSVTSTSLQYAAYSVSS